MAAVVWASAGVWATEPGIASAADEPPSPEAALSEASIPDPPLPEKFDSEAAAETPTSEDPGATNVYFLAIFSSQSVPKVPNRTHNWGIAVRGELTGDDVRVVEVQTISWMPATLQIRALRLDLERGVNLTSDQSFQYAVRNGQRISLWGIYEIHPSAYEKFVARRNQLQSGRIAYQCLDTIGVAGATNGGVNCIHALSDFAGLLPHIPTAAQPYGDESAALIARRLVERGLVINPRADHSWLAQELEWNRWGFYRRSPAGIASTTRSYR